MRKEIYHRIFRLSLRIVLGRLFSSKMDGIYTILCAVCTVFFRILASADEEGTSKEIINNFKILKKEGGWVNAMEKP